MRHKIDHSVKIDISVPYNDLSSSVLSYLVTTGRGIRRAGRESVQVETPTTTAIAIATIDAVTSRDAARTAVREAYIAMLAKPGVKTAGQFAIANANLHSIAVQFGKERRSATIERNWRAASAAMYLRPDTFGERIDAMVAECGPLTAVNFLSALQGVIRKSIQTLATPARANAIAVTSTRDGATSNGQGSWNSLLMAHAPDAVKVWAKTPTDTGKARSFNAHPLCHAYVPMTMMPDTCDDTCGYRAIDGIDPINDRK